MYSSKIISALTALLAVEATSAFAYQLPHGRPINSRDLPTDGPPGAEIVQRDTVGSDFPLSDLAVRDSDIDKRVKLPDTVATCFSILGAISSSLVIGTAIIWWAAHTVDSDDSFFFKAANWLHLPINNKKIVGRAQAIQAWVADAPGSGAPARNPGSGVAGAPDSREPANVNPGSQASIEDRVGNWIVDYRDISAPANAMDPKNPEHVKQWKQGPLKRMRVTVTKDQCSNIKIGDAPLQWMQPTTMVPLARSPSPDAEEQPESSHAHNE